jgi:hypothetical protein
MSLRGCVSVVENGLVACPILVCGGIWICCLLSRAESGLASAIAYHGQIDFPDLTSIDPASSALKSTIVSLHQHISESWALMKLCIYLKNSSNARNFYVGGCQTLIVSNDPCVPLDETRLMRRRETQPRPKQRFEVR